jgi:hypothetical protein
VDLLRHLASWAGAMPLRSQLASAQQKMIDKKARVQQILSVAEAQALMC